MKLPTFVKTGEPTKDDAQAEVDMKVCMKEEETAHNEEEPVPSPVDMVEVHFKVAGMDTFALYLEPTTAICCAEARQGAV